MLLGDRDLVNRLLKQSILTLCREAVDFSRRLEVDGIICLTVDDQEQHVVKIHESFDRPSNPENKNVPTIITSKEKMINKTSCPVEFDAHKNDHEGGKTFNSTLSDIEKNIQHAAAIDVDNILIKPDPDKGQSYSEIKQEEGSITGISLKEQKSATLICSDSLTYVDYSSIGDKKLSISSAKNILCKKCNSTLENVEVFQAHNMTSHNHFTCLVCLATCTSRNNMKRHIRLHTGIKPYACHKCSESFSRNDDFKRHLLKHTFQRPFRCAQCKTGFSDRACVKSHMMKEHNSKVYHVCPQCGESYIDIVKFQQHKKLHPELQDYRCSICSFTGSNSLMYNKHMLTHGPLKEYKCTYCNMSFSDPFMYTSHLKKHKGDEQVKSYTCCFCDMILQTFEQFQRHEHTHVHSKQHVCEICQKVFRYPSNLREHMLTHLPKSTYQCTRNLLSDSENLDNFRLKDGEMSFTTALRDERSNNESHKMEIDEENNNKVDTDSVQDLKNNDTNKEIIGGCSDYWCAECSHGFGTENELQNHISDIHEMREDSVNDGQENDENTDYEHKTKNTYPHENSTHVEYLQHHVLSEDTVDDNSDHYNENTRDSYKTNEQQNSTEKNTEQELNTVTDAMRQVKDIQSRFGIKPKVLDTFKPGDQTEPEIKTSIGNCSVGNEHSWLKPSFSVKSLPRYAPKMSGRQMFVSLRGTKMKIQRAHSSSSSSPDGTGRFFSTKELRGNQDKVSIIENALQADDSPQKSFNKSSSNTSSRSLSTTLNLKVRNPGFERVVTPDILFKTKAPFTCEVCEETFESFDEFHEHGVKVHRRFICSYCGKVFTSRPNRERHIRYHTGEKPYKCELCLATFLRGDDLKYHRTTKHADIKPFTCGACHTSFSLPKDLEKHLKLYPDHKL